MKFFMLMNYDYYNGNLLGIIASTELLIHHVFLVPLSVWEYLKLFKIKISKCGYKRVFTHGS